MLGIIVIVIAGALGGGVMTFAIGIPDSPCSAVTGVTRNFTIVANINGFNDSRDHQGTWPLMTVNRCDMVVIKIINDDTQSHGFAVDNYAPRGTEVIGQQSATVQFQAVKSGQFRVYCDVYCTVHIFMQSGLLKVL